jgi:hypothetical protein
VPWEAVWIKDGVGPRGINSATVEQYAESFQSLPPIRVQRGTFALIDGRHRLQSAAKAGSDFIRIEEVDVADEDLVETAFRANLEHGLPYSVSERIEGLKMLLKRHPDWPSQSFVALVGLSRGTVDKYRKPREPKPETTSHANPSPQATVVQNVQSSPQAKDSRVTREPIAEEWPDEEPELGYDDDGFDDEPTDTDATGGPRPTSPAVASAPEAKGAGGIDSVTSRADRDTGRAPHNIAGDDHDPDWFDLWSAVATLAEAQRTGRDVRRFLESMEPGIAKGFDEELELAAGFIDACREQAVFL